MVGVSAVRVVGPLASYVDGFQAELVRLGYSPRIARDHRYLLAHLSRWLTEEGLLPAEITTEVVARFVEARRDAGYRKWRSGRSLRPLLGYLREVGAVPTAEDVVADESGVEGLLDAYRRYLVIERRLAAATVRGYVDVARRFLSRNGGDRRVGYGPLMTCSDVTGFVVGEADRYGVGSMKTVTTALRSLLRFLFLTGVTETDLAGAVPAVAGRRATSLPRGVDGDVVAALLDSCDRTTAVGLRDFAILTLLVRLGLRAAEVAAMQLDDVDWRAGEVVVRGKANRHDRLPLPHDVGESLVDYLRYGRPKSACRALFLRACAPDGPMLPRSVVMVPRSASRRAGLPAVGAHRLRHTAATSMLRHGSSLVEVAQVLRHHDEATTAIYTTVDRAALEVVVRPWPEVSGR